MPQSRRRSRRTGEPSARAHSSTSIRGRLGSRVAALNNLVVDGEQVLAERIESLLAAGQLPSRNDIVRLRRRIAKLRRTLLDIDEAFDGLKPPSS